MNEDAPKQPLRLAPREVEQTEPLSRPGDGTEINVRLIHRANLLANPEPELTPMPERRRSRRSRDFLIILAVGAAILAVLSVVFRHWPEMVGISAFVIGMAVAVLGWVIFGIIDRY